MANFIDYYEYSKLATAAYVDLNVFDGESIAAAVNEAKRLPEKLAEQTFDSSKSENQPVWTVSEDGFYGNDAEGFAATLFQKGGQKVLAIRGTEPSISPSGDLLKADLGQIGFLGLAMGQALSMLNYIRRLQAGTNEDVQQLAWNYSLNRPAGAGADACIDLGSGRGYLYFSAMPKQKGLNLLAAGEKITVTGHSLGGHLAALAARLFPELIEDCYTFNAPGFDPDSVNIAAQIVTALTTPVLSSAIDAISGVPPKLTDKFVDLVGHYIPTPPANSFGQVSIHNLESEDIASGNDSSLVASVITGAHNLPPEMFIPTERNSHMIEPFMDSLSMQSVLYRMNPNITSAQIETLFQATSNSDADVLEKLVVALRDLLVGKGAPLTQIADAKDILTHIGTGDIDARAAYYAIFLEVEKAVKANSNLKLDLLTNQSVSSLVSLAQQSNPTGLATRYALKTGNPFALIGADYSAFNKNGELNLYDKASGAGMSDQYLKDRSAYLSWLIEANTQNAPSTNGRFDLDTKTSSTTNIWNFIDEQSGQKIVVTPARPNGGRNEIYFGGDDHDSFTSGSGDDRFYGGNGDDSLDGGAGNDYLEGNAGKDTLIGGAGFNTLVGGAGEDTYQIINDGKTDTIRDADGKGSVIVDGITLAGGERQGIDNLWLSSDGQVSYRYRNEKDNSILQVSILVGGEFKHAVDIENFPDLNAGNTAGALGINLKQGAAPDSITYFPATGLYNVVELSLVARAVQTGGKADNVQGNGGDDHIKLGAGNDLAMGWGGNDFIDGEDGNDYIIGGINNAAPGFIDSDTIIGGNERDWLRGYDGNDVMHGGRIDDHQLTSNNTGQTFGDWLTGDRGQDILYGSAAGDFLEGGAGADEVLGGAGDDLILGDGEFMQNSGTLGAGGDPNIVYWSDHGSGILRPTSGATILFLSGGMFNWTLGRTVIPGADDSVSMDYIDYQFTIGTGRTLSGARTSANGGDDLLYGGLGNDWIAGQTGSDVLYGDAGDDVLYGDDLNMSAAQSGDDWLYGGIGADRLYGGEGDDHLYANSGNPGQDDDVEDLLYGGAGDDHLFGGQNDKLYGGAGDDNLSSWGVYGGQLHGGTGDDQLFAAGIAAQAWGDAGDDYLTFERSADFVDGGEGFDTYFFNADSLRLPGSTEIRDSDGKGLININNTRLNQSALRAQKDGSWLAANGEFTIVQEGSTLTITLFENGQALLGKVRVTDYSDGHLGINLPVYVDPDAPDVPDVPPNHAPTPGALLAPPKVKVGEDFYYALPNDAFSDIDEGDSLSLAATLADGSALPAWLVFDAATQTFSGTPSSTDNRNIQIRLTATDQGGLSSSHVFDFAIIAANLVINGGSNVNGDNTLTGDSGDDTINGGAGNDTLVGGRGDDRLSGGLGNDTYVFKRGDGQDRLIDSGQNTGQSNILVFSDYALDDLQLFCTGNSLRFQFANGDELDSVLLDNYFNRMANNDNDEILQEVRFADGQSFSVQALIAKIGVYLDAATSDINTKTFTRFDDLIIGTANADTINGGAGNDTLVGGLGDDRLSGGLGNDTYVFKRGDGQDRLIDSGQNTGQSNILVFSDYALDDLQLFCTGNSLRFQFANGDELDSVLLDNYFNRMANNDNDEILQEVRFADGQSFSVQALIAKIGVYLDAATSDINTKTFTRFDDLIIGTANADTINGGAGNDTLVGGLGDDRLSGGLGNDTYVFKRGDGQDRLIDSGQNTGQSNILVFSDYALDDLQLFCTGNSLRFQFANGDELDSVLLDNYFNRMANNDNDEILQEVRFADGQSFSVQALIAKIGVYLDAATSDINTKTFTRFDDLIIGTANADTINGGAGNDTLVGGLGDDLINTGTGNDRIAFNQGDGFDTLTLEAGNKTLALGGGLDTAELALRKTGNDLVLDTGTDEGLLFKNWYVGTANQNLLTLQILAEVRAGADAAGDDTRLGEPKESFDFKALVADFDAARSANPNLDAWALTHALLDRHLSEANGAALGDDLITPSAMSSSLNALGNSPTQPFKNETPSQMQVLRPQTALQEGVLFG